MAWISRVRGTPTPAVQGFSLTLSHNLLEELPSILSVPPPSRRERQGEREGERKRGREAGGKLTILIS
jgi:hypothetical protein